MKLNNKGFAISTLIYGVLVLFVTIFMVLIFSITSSYKKQKIYSDRAIIGVGEQTKITLKEAKVITSTDSYEITNDGEYYIKKKSGLTEIFVCKVNLKKNDKILLNSSNTFVIKNTNDKLCSVENYSPSDQIFVDSYIFDGSPETYAPGGEPGGDSDDDLLTFISKLKCNSCSVGGNGVNLSLIDPIEKLKVRDDVIKINWTDVIGDDSSSKYSRYIIKVLKISGSSTELIGWKIVNSNESTFTKTYLSIDKNDFFFVEVYGVTTENVYEGIGKTETTSLNDLQKNEKYTIFTDYDSSYITLSINNNVTQFSSGDVICFRVTKNSAVVSSFSVTVLDYSGNPIPVIEDNNLYTIDTTDLQSSITIKINNSLSTYNVGASYNTGQITVTGVPTVVEHGGTINFSVNTVNSNYVVTNISVQDNSTSTVLNNCTWNTTGTKTCSNITGPSTVYVVSREKRNYAVNYVGSNVTWSNNPSTVKEGNSLSFTVTANSDYKVTSVSVRSDSSTGTVLCSWTSDGTKTCNLKASSTLYVVAETESTGCLAEGTKILLADGSYKNIENIEYNDLLQVIDFKNGGITYEYPVWIENESISDKYTLITLDDNTRIKVILSHAFFSYDYNEFISTEDKEKFHEGITIAKLESGHLKKAKVIKIEEINDKVKYYHVVSNKYYNIVANNIITTDHTVVVSNLYGFNENISWKSKQTKDLYSYEELNMLPKYLYYGLRAGEGKKLQEFGLGYDEFKYYLLNNQLNEKMWNKPKLNNNGKREWMVTTSEDVVTEENKKMYLKEEGSYYTLKIPKTINGKKFIGWFNTADSKTYNPGDKVEVLYGTHFIAKYEDIFSMK